MHSYYLKSRIHTQLVENVAVYLILHTSMIIMAEKNSVGKMATPAPGPLSQEVREGSHYGTIPSHGHLPHGIFFPVFNAPAPGWPRLWLHIGGKAGG